MSKKESKQTNNIKQNKNQVPENFTLSLVLVDALPVLFFGGSAVLISLIFHSTLFLLGALLCLAAGTGKVLWKLIIVAAHKNIWLLNRQLRVLMPAGFILMVISAVIGHSRISLSAIISGITSFPAVICFSIGLLGICLMGYFATHLDGSDAKANWIEQITNAVAQGAIFVGLAILVAGGAGTATGNNMEPSKDSSTATTQESISKPTTEATTEQTLTIADINSMSAGSVLTEEDLETFTGKDTEEITIDDLDDLFFSEKIPDEVFERMDGVSFGEDCILSRSDLRYIRVLHRNAEGDTQIGELVCNKALAEDMVEIFQELYDNDYKIEKMLLVDNYDGDDEASMEDNNTSCFNFRKVPGSTHLSQHAYGRAIDINPLYNPYVTGSGYMPDNAGDYVDRSGDIPYKIDTDDLCYKLFTEHGFIWGGSWNSEKDYQHFQKKG